MKGANAQAAIVFDDEGGRRTKQLATTNLSELDYRDQPLNIDREELKLTSMEDLLKELTKHVPAAGFSSTSITASTSTQSRFRIATKAVIAAVCVVICPDSPSLVLETIRRYNNGVPSDAEPTEMPLTKAITQLVAGGDRNTRLICLIHIIICLALRTV